MSRSSKGLSKRDTSRLSAALDDLPAAIKYLRDPILDIARQDQDLLGSGEADTNLLANALRQNSLEEEAEAAADLLQGWIEGQNGNESAWAGPVWFVEGFLRGGQLFGEEGEEAAPSMPPPLGLQRIHVDVPKGMKMKLHRTRPAMMELKNREVQILVVEWNEKDWEYEYKWGQWRAAPSLPTYSAELRPPHLRDERDIDFKIGKTTGERRIWRHVNSGMAVICATLLDLPDVKVEITMLSRKPLGFDLSKYEEFLSSIRQKEPE